MIWWQQMKWSSGRVVDWGGRDGKRVIKIKNLFQSIKINTSPPFKKVIAAPP